MTCLFLICAFIESLSNKRSIYADIRVLVNGTEAIELWENGQTNSVYVFLPSYAELDKTRFLIDDS